MSIVDTAKKRAARVLRKLADHVESFGQTVDHRCEDWAYELASASRRLDPPEEEGPWSAEKELRDARFRDLMAEHGFPDPGWFMPIGPLGAYTFQTQRPLPAIGWMEEEE